MISLLYGHQLKNLPLPLFVTCLRAFTHRQKEGNHPSLLSKGGWEGFIFRVCIILAESLDKVPGEEMRNSLNPKP